MFTGFDFGMNIDHVKVGGALFHASVVDEPVADIERQVLSGFVGSAGAHLIDEVHLGFALRKTEPVGLCVAERSLNPCETDACADKGSKGRAVAEIVVCVQQQILFFKFKAEFVFSASVTETFAVAGFA